MTHKLILKVKKSQLSGAKRFGTVEETPPGGGFHTPPILIRVKRSLYVCVVKFVSIRTNLNQI